jgi:hypothetical protein
MAFNRWKPHSHTATPANVQINVSVTRSWLTKKNFAFSADYAIVFRETSTPTVRAPPDFASEGTRTPYTVFCTLDENNLKTPPPSLSNRDPPGGI